MKRARKGSGHIRKRGRIYYIVYSVNGKHHEVSTHSTKLADAQKLLRERLMAAGTAPPRREQEILLNELLEDLEQDYRLHHRRSVDTMLDAGLKRLRPYWGTSSVTEVTTERMREYRKSREAERAAVATINNELALLRRAFHLARRATPPKITLAPYFPMVKPHNARKGFLEPGDYERLLAELPRHLKPLLVVAYHVGCRRGELLGRRKTLSGLKWDQVDLIHDQIVLWPGTTKNDEGRILPIYGQMKPWLVMLRQERDHVFPGCPWVFQHDGAPIKEFRGAWESACERAGVAWLRFHDLRRSAVRHMMRAGFDRKHAMAISGHKTEATFERYNIVSERDLREDIQKLEAYMRELLRPASEPQTEPAAKKEPIQ